MGRPLRLEFAGALYHVTSRGDRREDIYDDDEDRRRFLDRLGYVCEHCNWVCHSYCLMSNHYHLLIETVEGNLSDGMRQLNGFYSQNYNRRHGKVGHVFQGRYKAILVEKESYLLELCRYVELNPVRARMVYEPADWPWSSYRAMVGHVVPQSWLVTDWVLSSFSMNKSSAIKSYIEFVKEGKGQPALWEKLKNQVYLGSDNFIEMSIKKANIEQGMSENYVSKKCRMVRPLEDYNKSSDDRNTSIILAYQSGGYSMKEIGQYFGLSESMVRRILKNSRFMS